MKTIIVDIETGALPEMEILPFMPEFSAPSNYRDPEKIEAYIREARARWLAEGALSAITGRVLCIGTLTGDHTVFYEADDEAVLLASFWDDCAAHIRNGDRLVGYCSKEFDFPFVIRRSWRHDVNVPWCLWDGQRFAPAVVDLAEKWACNSHNPAARISLDTLAKFLRVGAKNGSGRDFAALWRSDRTKAREYLKNDLELTALAAQRLLVKL